MKILIVGADGQLGQFLSKSSLFNSWSVLSVGRYDLDITDTNNVDLIISNFKPNFIINAAAFTDVEEAETYVSRSMDVNCHGVQNLATAAKKNGSILVHISTDYVFDGHKISPYNESDEVSPVNCYGHSKFAGELILSRIMSKFIIIRTSWLFGGDKNNFFFKIVKLLKSSNEISVVDDQIGGPTYVGDLANLIATIIRRYESLNKFPWGVYHYSGHPFVSRFQFACYINQSLNFDCAKVILPATSKNYSSSVRRPLNSCLDSAQVLAIFGVPPSNWQKAVALLSAEINI